VIHNLADQTFSSTCNDRGMRYEAPTARGEAGLPGDAPSLGGAEIEDQISISLEDQRQIAQAILNPPDPGPALKRAFDRRRQLFGAHDTT